MLLLNEEWWGEVDNGILKLWYNTTSYALFSYLQQSSGSIFFPQEVEVHELDAGVWGGVVVLSSF